MANENDSIVEFAARDQKIKENDYRPKDLLPSNGGYKDDIKARGAQGIRKY